ncbi:MAG TPA: methionyl-tRNA formyltransferase, partial [Methanocorpusculum sp.]|nr:methionyl-tRNA formyltransferase [Methanocorpusculum sp.]
PGANTLLPGGRRLIVYRSEMIDCNDSSTRSPGEVIGILKRKGPVVMTGSGALCILSAKPEGKREMPGIELVNGHYVSIGDKIGSI